MGALFRAVLMLGVLVGLPAAWVYYGPLPEGGQKMVDRIVRLARESLGQGSQLPDSPAMDLAPRFGASEIADLPALTVSAAQPSAKTPVAASTGLAEQVEPLLAQLRGHGVAEYQLDRWGREGLLFRFQCQMPLAGSDDHTQQFEAVAEDPVASVRQVVDQVGSWQLARLSNRRLR